MENFDYDKMMVNFQGKEYPIKEITLEDGSVTLVSTEALDVALICDEDGMPISKEAILITCYLTTSLYAWHIALATRSVLKQKQF